MRSDSDSQLEKMFLAYALLLQLFFITIARGERCQTLEGTWYNEVGSKLQLNHSEDGLLSGQYTSRNEFRTVLVTVKKFDVLGTATFNQSDALFVFSTTNSHFVKSWIGQCFCENDIEILHTSWLSHQNFESCSSKGQTTNVGQHVFTRNFSSSFFSSEETKTFPLKQDLLKKNISQSVGRIVSSPVYGQNVIKKVLDTKSRLKRLLDGNWYNQLGSKLFIDVMPNMTINGEYHTAVESRVGSAGKVFPKVFGVAFPMGSNGPISLHVIWNKPNGTSATVWVGQHVLCGKNQTSVLITNWLLKTKVQSFENNWKAVLFGEDIFTRNKQKLGK